MQHSKLCQKGDPYNSGYKILSTSSLMNSRTFMHASILQLRFWAGKHGGKIDDRGINWLKKGDNRRKAVVNGWISEADAEPLLGPVPAVVPDGAAGAADGLAGVPFPHVWAGGAGHGGMAQHVPQVIRPRLMPGGICMPPPAAHLGGLGRGAHLSMANGSSMSLDMGMPNNLLGIGMQMGSSIQQLQSTILELQSRVSELEAPSDSSQPTGH